MPTFPEILRRVRGSSSAVDVDAEEGRSFLQERLAFYNQVCFLISGAFFLVGGALLFVGLPAPEPISVAQQRQAMALHATTLVIQLGAWLALKRGPRLSAAWLGAVDAGALFLVSAGFCLQFVSAVSARGPHLVSMGPFPRVTLVLIMTHLLVARAVFVPSLSAWTTLVSAIAEPASSILGPSRVRR
jgi:hypothetical protein